MFNLYYKQINTAKLNVFILNTTLDLGSETDKLEIFVDKCKSKDKKTEKKCELFLSISSVHYDVKEFRNDNSVLDCFKYICIKKIKKKKKNVSFQFLFIE